MADPLPNYGGHSLEGVPILDPKHIASLRNLGFTDVEQVVSAVRVRDVSRYLSTALGLTAAQVEDLISAMRTVVPEAAGDGDLAEFPLGALPPTPEIEEINAGAALPQIAAPLPSSINHADMMSPGKQQGSRGTCVSFAMTAGHEYYRRASRSANEDYSEQFLYHETKLIDGQPNICGTWQVKAAQVLASLGQCLEAVWPYNPNPPCNNNGTEPASARPEASGRTLQTIILPPKDVTAIKGALAAGSVVGFSIPVYGSWYRSAEVARSGRITMRIGNEPSQGGHAMCLIGYQDDDSAPGGGYFILRNSWYGLWGTECPYGSGNGTIPYAYISAENWEAVSTPSIGAPSA